MSLADFTPENDLETAIVKAQAGTLPIPEMLWLLSQANLYIASRAEVQPDGGGFEPLLFEGEDGGLVAAFSALSRLDTHKHMAGFVLETKGEAFFKRLPPNIGVVVNPGFAAQLVMPPSGVAEMQADLAARETDGQ